MEKRSLCYEIDTGENFKTKKKQKHTKFIV